MRSVAVCLSVLFASSSVVGCAVGVAPASEELGELRLPLVTSVGGGTLFRLSAQFTITPDNGGAGQVIDGSGDTGSVTVALAPGGYTVAIVDGFVLERSDVGLPFRPVPAVLASPKAVNVSIQPSGSSFISYQFLVTADPPSGSTLSISFGVAQRRGQLVGTLSFESAAGVFAPYLQAAPPSFAAPYIITGEGVLSEPPTHDFFTGTVGFQVLSDGVGVLSALAPGMAGGNLSFAIQTRPDDSQQFQLQFTSAFSAPFSRLTIATTNLSPTVPVGEQRIPLDPVLSQFRAIIPFTLQGATGFDVASGQIDLQFVP